MPEDVDEALEQSESFLGIAFVAAQTYISGTVADARALAKSTTKPHKIDLLKNFSSVISGTGITKMQLCDAIANYFKHHDEWPDWTPKPKEPRKQTIDTLNAVGITEMTTYPCQEAAKILWEWSSPDLEPLFLCLLSGGRKSLPHTNNAPPNNSLNPTGFSKAFIVNLPHDANASRRVNSGVRRLIVC